MHTSQHNDKDLLKPGMEFHGDSHKNAYEAAGKNEQEFHRQGMHVNYGNVKKASKAARHITLWGLPQAGPP